MNSKLIVDRLKEAKSLGWVFILDGVTCIRARMPGAPETAYPYCPICIAYILTFNPTQEDYADLLFNSQYSQIAPKLGINSSDAADIVAASDFLECELRNEMLVVCGLPPDFVLT